MRYLRVSKKLCTGCRMCETACSLAKEGVINRARSRIRVIREGVVELKPLVCLQCKDPVCIKVCPVHAISSINGAVRVDEDICTGCGQCVLECPRLFISPEGLKAIMCDQCGSCVPSCPEKALSIEEN